MKVFLLFIARLLFVAVYSISVGLLTGFIWMKTAEYVDSKKRKAIQFRQAAA